MNAVSIAVLSDLELDALTELVNIGVSRAATSLRAMVGEQVLLSVPSVALVSRARAVVLLSEQQAGRLVAVHQGFEGAMSGDALLIFPQERSLELVRMVAGPALALEDIIELEAEALAETGNIILNGCLGTMANMLGRTLRISLPGIVRGESADFFGAPTPDADVVVFVYIKFTMRERNVDGFIALVMDLPNISALKVLLGELIARMTGADVKREDAAP